MAKIKLLKEVYRKIESSFKKKSISKDCSACSNRIIKGFLLETGVKDSIRWRTIKYIFLHTIKTY